MIRATPKHLRTALTDIGAVLLPAGANAVAMEDLKDEQPP